MLPFDVSPAKLRRNGGKSHILKRQIPRVRAFIGTLTGAPSPSVYEKVPTRHGGSAPLSPRIFPMFVVNVTSIGSCDSKNTDVRATFAVASFAVAGFAGACATWVCAGRLAVTSTPPASAAATALRAKIRGV